MKSGRISDQQISQSSYWICDGFEYKGILGRLDHRWCWIANQHKRKSFFALSSNFSVDFNQRNYKYATCIKNVYTVFADAESGVFVFIKQK